MTVPIVPIVPSENQARKQGQIWDDRFDWDNTQSSQSVVSSQKNREIEHEMTYGTIGTIGTILSDPCHIPNKIKFGNYCIITAHPATGILYIINNFLSGHIRVRGRGNGAYPFLYLEMLDNVFGVEKNTIEVCSGSVKDCFTVDINPECKPDLVADGQDLARAIQDHSFSRWRCDPPYNEKTAKEMYGTELPKLGKLLTEGDRVVKAGSLMFLLCSQNYQWCPPNCKRIGLVYISVVPNNETRVLNIYVKLDDDVKDLKKEQK